jgi:hypothetical protein
VLRQICRERRHQPLLEIAGSVLRILDRRHTACQKAGSARILQTAERPVIGELNGKYRALLRPQGMSFVMPRLVPQSFTSGLVSDVLIADDTFYMVNYPAQSVGKFHAWCPSQSGLRTAGIN